MALKVSKHRCLRRCHQNTEAAIIHQKPTPKTFQCPATKIREIQNVEFSRTLIIVMQSCLSKNWVTRNVRCD
jgi:hypothetical protein